MTPPWVKYPEIQARSIGWRMGYGETYMLEFRDWLKRKSPEHLQRYAQENPEPSGWEGFYGL
jgi:hypothetical protein